MLFPLRGLLTACVIYFSLFVSDGRAQETSAPTNKDQDLSLGKEAFIHCKSTLSEADKKFIVNYFSGLEKKVISITPVDQLFRIRYTENLKERDILEILLMNGYDSYLMKGEYIKVTLTVNGEAKEDFVK